MQTAGENITLFHVIPVDGTYAHNATEKHAFLKLCSCYISQHFSVNTLAGWLDIMYWPCNVTQR